MVALDRWSLYTGLIACKRYRDCTKLVFIDRWFLYTGGLSSRFDCSSLLSAIYHCNHKIVLDVRHYYRTTCTVKFSLTQKHEKGVSVQILLPMHIWRIRAQSLWYFNAWMMSKFIQTSTSASVTFEEYVHKVCDILMHGWWANLYKLLALYFSIEYFRNLVTLT